MPGGGGKRCAGDREAGRDREDGVVIRAYATWNEYTARKFGSTFAQKRIPLRSKVSGPLCMPVTNKRSFYFGTELHKSVVQVGRKKPEEMRLP